jgi:hypothetical protein
MPVQVRPSAPPIGKSRSSREATLPGMSAFGGEADIQGPKALGLFCRELRTQAQPFEPIWCRRLSSIHCL